jgi:hypothetical protein
VRAAATTAVVAGTAGAVRHRQEQKYAQKDYEQQMAAQQQYEAQAAAQQQYAAPPPAPAGGEPDYMAELEQLAELKNAGIITEEEFEAKKKQLLGI